MLKYLEPRTDVPAKDDWSTGLILQELGLVRRTLSIIALVALAGLVGCLFLPMEVGNIAAIVVLSLFLLLGAIGPVMHRVETLPVRRGLLEEPWRQCPATVVNHPDDKYAVYVQLPDGVVLESFMGDDLRDVVRDRGEIFLCGPNANGKAVVRVAGLADTANAKVTRPAEFVAEEPAEPHEIGRPLDDPAVLKAFSGVVAGTRSTLGATIPAAIGVVIVLMSLWPIAPAGLVVGGLVVVLSLLMLPSLIELSRWYRDAVKGLHAAQRWISVPITLFPWKPGSVVAGLATMEGGRLALVQFVDPTLHVIANIADTGTMWIAGVHGDVIAVGLPRLPVLTIAAIQPDSDTPREAPVPWIQRLRQPDFSGLPR
ncbi:hypothetical protein [Lentzea flava]|uniref:Uncharacterized protein n=1 Tax=Lentzea flava TaxID=103732 RepID=A0ABQ2UCR5_9PSEU|nr:hypothetical protein [Lentzea flava]MCP2196872.1 hypothetical protein [Lentzea flava]GGU14874.1 hypothetical protein GCM10010178_02940 [Lentzea flava]